MADTTTGAKSSIISKVTGFVKSNKKSLAIGGGLGLGIGIPTGVVLGKVLGGKKKSK